MTRGPSWSDDERDLVRLMFKMGKTDLWMSVVVGRSEDSINAERNRLGLVRRPKVEIPDKIVTTMASPKHSDNLPDIGELIVTTNEHLGRQSRFLVEIIELQTKQLELFSRLANEPKK